MREDYYLVLRTPQVRLQFEHDDGILANASCASLETPASTDSHPIRELLTGGDRDWLVVMRTTDLLDKLARFAENDPGLMLVVSRLLRNFKQSDRPPLRSRAARIHARLRSAGTKRRG